MRERARRILRTAGTSAGAIAIAALMLGVQPVAADDVAPTVAITAPAPNTTTGAGTLQVTVSFGASANDPNSPTGNVTLVQLTLDGAVVGERENAPGTKSGSFTFAVDLTAVPNGEHTLVARAFQGSASSGHMSISAPTTIHVARAPADATPPTISARIDPPANAAGWHTQPVSVTFEAADTGSGIASVTPPVSVSGDGAGQIVTGTARDGAGNEASTSVRLDVDRTGPSLAVLAPGDGATVTARSIVVTGTVADATSGVAGVTCGGAAADRSGGAFACAVALASGANTIVVRAADVAGNTSEATLRITSAAAGTPSTPPAAPVATADVSVTTVVAPSVAAPGERVTYSVTARNGGPGPATGVVVTTSFGTAVEVVSATATKGGCSGTTSVTCSLGTLAAQEAATITIVVIAAEADVGASVGIAAAQPDPVTGNNVAQASVHVVAAAQPVPVQGVSAVATPVSGTVLVNGRPIGATGLIRVGAVVDTRNGKIRLRTTTGVGVFSAGAFRLRQPKKRGAQAELQLLADVARACRGASRALARIAAKPKPPAKKVVARLWGQSSGAHFTTKSRYSSATVRGTVWLVSERCDGSVTTVRVGRVEVRDLVRRRTVVLSAGQSYLARP